MSKRIIYISGPMTGLPQNNFPAFHAAAQDWRTAGYAVRNPAEVGEEVGLAWTDYMRKDLKLLAECNTIFLLQGWEKSQGAHLELQIAHRLGFDVLLQAKPGEI